MTKQPYRVRNWENYNKILVQRGSIDLWFDEATLQGWKAARVDGKRGRPQEYSDIAIECGLTLKAIFKLPFRMTEGFIGSLVKCLKLDLQVPHYTLLCKRQKALQIELPKIMRGRESLHILVDSTGMKIYGEGEWKVRQHGWVKHRQWRK
jgi:hypothetical protein